MIQYFYYQKFLINGEWYVSNEKIIYEKPRTSFDGYEVQENNQVYSFYVDVEKYISYYGSLEFDFKKIYDKLLLEQRNLKLETI